MHWLNGVLEQSKRIEAACLYICSKTFLCKYLDFIREMYINPVLGSNFAFLMLCSNSRTYCVLLQLLQEVQRLEILFTNFTHVPSETLRVHTQSPSVHSKQMSHATILTSVFGFISLLVATIHCLPFIVLVVTPSIYPVACRAQVSSDDVLLVFGALLLESHFPSARDESCAQS